MASYLHRTAQPSTLAAFRPWGSSTGAGRIRLAGAKIRELKVQEVQEVSDVQEVQEIFGTL